MVYTKSDVIFSLLLWSFVHERNWDGRRMRPWKSRNMPGLWLEKRAGGRWKPAPISPILGALSSDGIRSQPSQQNADLFPLRAHHRGLKSEWPRSPDLRQCVELAASMIAKWHDTTCMIHAFRTCSTAHSGVSRLLDVRGAPIPYRELANELRRIV